MREPVFGVQRFGSLEEKAAAIVDIIVRRHVFGNGNKRTGAAVLVIILEENGVEFNPDEDDFMRVMEEIAEGTMFFLEVVEWVRSHSTGGGASPD